MHGRPEAPPRYPRYAIYFVPDRDSAVYRFGASLLGYDAFGGSTLPFPTALTETVADWSDLTRDPRLYGFHATLKAPFALAAGTSETGLVDACAAFAARTSEAPEIAPVVAALGAFVALVPGTRSAALDDLAAACVRDFDGFRAPLTAEDRARRNPTALTVGQVAHLDRWGYPYVFDDFQFHMTLTGRLPAERQGQVLALLRERFATAVGGSPLAVDRIALSRQDAAGRPFRILTQPILGMKRCADSMSTDSGGRP